jgi:hypothetical protein
MRKHLPCRLASVLVALSLGAKLHGQAVSPTTATPDATTAVSFGPSLKVPLGDGTVHYDLNASEILENGSAFTGTAGWGSMTNAGGDLSYISGNAALPSSVLYSGGYLWTNVPGLASTTYQNITFSQGLVRKAWSVAVSNTFSYLPLSPAFGISGLPGVGDLGVQTSQAGSGPAPTLLSNFSTILADSVTGAVTRSLDYNTSVFASVQWGTMRFLGQPGLDNTDQTESAGVNRRLNARNTLGVDYAYSSFTYPGLGNFSFISQSLNFLATRRWTRAISLSASIGPQWISSSDAAAFPPQTDLAAAIAFTYTGEFNSANIGYSRGAMSGLGVMPGGFEDSVQGSVQQALGRNWSVAYTASYIRTSGFGSGSYGYPGSNIFGVNAANALIAESTGNIAAEYGGVQLNRRLATAFSTFVSYTAENQSYGQSAGAQNALNGFGQFVGIGITFAPRSKRLGQI